MKTLINFSLLVIGLLSSQLGASAQIVANSDFSSNAAAFTAYPGYVGGRESGATTEPLGPNPDIASWTSNNTSSGLNAYGDFADPPYPNSYYTIPFGPSGYSASDPAVYAFIQDGGTSLTQTINLTLGAEYRLSFYSAPRGGNGGDGTIGADVSVSNSTLALGIAATTSNSDFTLTTTDFYLLTTGSATLTLANTSVSGDNTEDFADVSITQIGSTPEPAAYALLGLGAVALLFVSRRIASQA